MARRNREINIFNMSLLDILCGALGAFCFMMLALLPYYRSGDDKAVDRDKEIQELLNKLHEMESKLNDPELAKELAEMLKQLQARFKELQGELNYTRNQRDDLQHQLQALAAKLSQAEQQLANAEKAREQAESRAQELSAQQKGLQDQLAAAQAKAQQAEAQSQKLQTQLAETQHTLANYKAIPPFLVPTDHKRLWVSAYSDNRVQLLNVEYVSGGKTDTPFDPRVIRPGAKLSTTDAGVPQYCGAGVENVRFPILLKLYYSQYGLLGQKDASAAITGFALSKDYWISLPEVRVTGDRPWVFVGYFIQRREEEKPSFRPATPEEREKDWLEVNERIKGTAPDKTLPLVGPAAPAKGK